MYTTRTRALEPLVLPGSIDRRSSTGFPIVHREWVTTLQQVVEYVYSWRTGVPSTSDVAPSETSLFGIKQPRKSGSLTDRLADRKRFYEEVQRAAFPAETGTGAQSKDRVSQSDNGHLFSKVTALRYPNLVQLDASSLRPTGTLSGVRFDELASVIAFDGSPGVPNDSGFSYPFTNHIASLSTATNRQNTANSFFAATAPERASAHILTTVVELLRGDVPSLLKNYRRALFDYQSKTRSLRYAGSEYLNIQFGWQPLIAEYANVLKVLMGIDRMVYAESNRRKRMWDGPSTSSVSDYASQTATFNPVNIGGLGERYCVTVGDRSDSISPARYDSTVKSTVKEDYKFTARYSSLVKPNARSNGFVERAEETLRQLGLVDDPSILWELTPWSWLVDWASNIGASINNAHTLSPLSGRHSVDYAYFTTQLVESRVETITKQTLLSYSQYNRSRVIRPSSDFTTVSRTRSRATPFGFGTQLGSISAAQFAILVALGLARYR